MTSARREPLLAIGDGETITALERREVVILAERPDLTITWSRYAAGERGPGLHVHREHTDAFYVLEGELMLTLGPAREQLALPAGGFAAVTPNVVHGFDNDGPADAIWLNLHAPDQGFADYMRGLRDGTGVPFDSADPPDDGGRPAEAAIVSRPGEGERIASGLVKCDLPELRVVEWAAGAERPAGVFFELDDGVLGAHASQGDAS
jgi:quercetin dioxygenase-like cupin family protein